MALFLNVLPAAFPSLPSEKPRFVSGSPNYHHAAVCLCSLPASVSSPLQETTSVVRRPTSFHPTMSDDCFIESLTTFDEAYVASATQRIDELKEDVDYMLRNVSIPLQTMNLIDTIERLGLAYHFEKDIQLTLQQIYEYCDIDDSLHVVALRFRLLRQEGYDVPCDVFDKFKDKDGNFKQKLRNNVSGLLSLYEASHLSIYGEDILDEALIFTTENLNSICSYSDPFLARHIKHALGLPLHKSMPRLETRHFISYYEAHETRNNVLLELAKLDFNLLQSNHRKEIKEVVKWRKGMDPTGKLPFVLDGVVVCYLFAMQVNFLPQFSQGRILLAKYFNMFPLIDETYEVYGALDELELFTDAIARWDPIALDQLPDHMKVIYLAIYNLFNEIENMSLNDRGISAIYYLRESLGEVCAAHLQEARWSCDGYVPSMDEYLRIATLTVHFPISMIIAALGMRELITNEALDYMLEGLKLPWFITLVIRLSDDLAPSKDDCKQGDVAKSVECYMKEHGVSEEAAREQIKHRIAEAWKGINQELLQPNPLPKILFKGMVDFARSGQTYFLDGNDGIGKPESSFINSLLFESIPM